MTTAPARIGSIAASPRSNESASLTADDHDPGPLPAPGCCGPGSGGSVGVPWGRYAEGVGLGLGCTDAVALALGPAGVAAAVVRLRSGFRVPGSTVPGRGVDVEERVGVGLGRGIVLVGDGVGRTVRVGVGVAVGVVVVGLGVNVGRGGRKGGRIGGRALHVGSGRVIVGVGSSVGVNVGSLGGVLVDCSGGVLDGSGEGVEVRVGVTVGFG